MSITLQGVGGAPGIVIGQALVYRPHQDLHDPIDESPEAALARFAEAQINAAERLFDLAETQREQGHEHEAGIFDYQSLLVEDPALTDEVVWQIKEENQPLLVALARAIDKLSAQFAALDNPTLRERAADVVAVGNEIRRFLAGNTATLAAVPNGAIIVAADLSPAETVELQGQIGGFATAHGGPTGHTAILARSRGIPAVVGLGAAALEISEHTEIILDGNASQLIIAPSAEQLAAYQRQIAADATAKALRATFRDQPGRLADGRPVALWANIARPSEAHIAREHGAEGIGLFRTEILFYGDDGKRNQPPNEDEHLAFYRETLDIMGPRPVVIRTIDIGGDKPVPYLAMPVEANPFLGVRALRLCMQRPDLFQTQLRGLLRAAVHGDLWIMLPMVATPEDLAWGRAQLQRAAADLAQAGIDHRTNVPLGIMIETPAAAVTADLLARDVAFFSVGSNDLTQYTMAADRGLAELSQRYPHTSTAVLRLIEQATQAAKAAGIVIGVCGDLAGDLATSGVLAGLGIDELSMAAPLIPLVKEHLLTLSTADAHTIAAQAVRH
jgi:phosphotransferase system enzyme I (PtsI)